VNQVMTSRKQRIEKLRAIIEEKSKVDPEAAAKLKILSKKEQREAASTYLM